MGAMRSVFRTDDAMATTDLESASRAVARISLRTRMARARVLETRPSAFSASRTDREKSAGLPWMAAPARRVAASIALDTGLSARARSPATRCPCEGPRRRARCSRRSLRETRGGARRRANPGRLRRRDPLEPAPGLADYFEVRLPLGWTQLPGRCPPRLVSAHQLALQEPRDAVCGARDLGAIDTRQPVAKPRRESWMLEDRLVECLDLRVWE
jgi:hypothetical protein